MKRLRIFSLLILSIATNAVAENADPDNADYENALFVENVPYYDNIASNEKNNIIDPYLREKGVLDIYCPKSESLLPTIVWFHGGGLSVGQKQIPNSLKDQEVCVVAANYRLYPKIKSPVYVEDAATAVAWVFKNIKRYGGNDSQIFVSGHSAGGYLAAMIGIDKKWLSVHDIDANRLAGIIPFSGHTITHFTVRKERGIAGTQPIVDAMAPLYHVRDDASPLVLITGDREKELLGRYEENAYMMRMMKVVGHKQTKLIEIGGYGHDMQEPAFPILLEEVKKLSKQSK